MSMKFTNNAVSTLLAGITNVATSLSVQSGIGGLFPTLAAGDYFYCTLGNATNVVEIVKVTARAVDTFTVVRGQDGTAAVAWNAGDKVELRLVAASLNDFSKVDEANNAATTTGSGTAYILTPPIPLTAYTPNVFSLVTFNVASGLAPTIQISGLATPPNLVKQLSDGTYGNIAANDIPANHRSFVVLLSATQALVLTLPTPANTSSGATGFGADKVFIENDRYQTGNYVLGQNSQNTCTISIAAPAVVTQVNTFVGGEEIFFMSTGALPTGLAVNTTYFVATTGLSGAGFQVALTRGGAAVTTTGTQSGAQSVGKAKSGHNIGPQAQAAGVTFTVPTGQRFLTF
jgi:hypothetical protein